MSLPYDSDRVTRSGLFDEKAFRQDLAVLETLPLWNGASGVLQLWQHQKEAIALGAAYLNTPPGAAPESALIKMPTGSGKSGVIAVLARALPKIKKVLILTPREGLVAQMRDDVRWRFWKIMGLTDQTKGVWHGSGLEQVEAVKLLPNKADADRVTLAAKKERAVVIGTLQALDQLRVKSQKLERRKGTADEAQADAETLAWITRLLAALKGFDLVIVDEGHYEPAPSWSRSVRLLERPTILLSATPFRNDYKLFSVRGSFAYNLPFPEARRARIVRGVTFAHGGLTPSAADPDFAAGDEDTKAETVLTVQEAADTEAFAARVVDWSRTVVPTFGLPNPKIIVRAGSYEHLVALQQALEAASGQTAVLIHERVGSDPTIDRKVKDRTRFVQVRHALESQPAARFWLHQTKLLEGIDDASFVGVALYEEFANARQLIQQIGRVLRSSDPTRAADQTAALMARDALAQARVETSWAQYLAFEQSGAGDLANIIPGEAYLPQKILPQMPNWQYVNGQFRERLPLDLELAKDDLRVPLRAVIFNLAPGFNWETLKAEALEGILARDRFVVRPINDLPDHCLGWTFFTVDESPYLARHFVTEWRFGLNLIARLGDRLFVFDTDGVPFDPDKAGVERLARRALATLLRDDSPAERVRITRLSASSLDMSARAIRTMTTSAASFAETFTDLLDSVLLPTNVAGYVGGVGRYLGLTRGKVTDTSAERVPIDGFLDWARGLDADLSASRPASSVFGRYVQSATPDPAKAGKPASILLDLEPMEEFGAFLRGGAVQPTADAKIDLLDLCSDIGPKGDFKVTTPAGEELAARVEYLPKSERYRIESKALDAAAGKARSATGTPQTLTQVLNTTQAFRILTEEVDKVYMHGEWVRARDLIVDGEVLPLRAVSQVPALKQTIVEKGEVAWKAKDPSWSKTSVFGLTHHYLDRRLPNRDAYAKALDEFSLILLDDDGSEICDFVLVSDQTVVLLHAKASEKGAQRSVTALQEVGRQAVASLAFYNTPDANITDDRWRRAYTANKTSMPQVDRVFRNDTGVQNSDVAGYVRRAFSDPARSKEVWIVLGNLIDTAQVERLAKATPMSNPTRQLLMYIESLRTACGRANADLRIFG